MSFSDLGLAAPIVRSLSAAGYSTPTPIQSQAIPPALAGRDVLGCAQTGTGKTAAFALPIIQRLMSEAPAADQPRPVPPRPAFPPGGPHRGGPHGRGNGRRPGRSEPYRPLRALILAPTRELAVQIAESIHQYAEGSGLRLAAIYGGVGYQRQFDALRAGVDILVATPGRLVDLLGQGHGDLSTLKIFVLDEADRMLDMGFMPDLRRIVERIPEQRQTLFFSATMPGEIAKLANELLHDPVRIDIAPSRPAAERIEQSVCFVPKAMKTTLLVRWLAQHEITRAIVFTRTKHGADRVAEQLDRAGIRADAIHGNKSQNARQRTLNAFRDSELHVLVATDLAARGIDVDGISHVFNYDLPHEPDTYVHRIGRTARAGASGAAVSFCDREERGMLRGIERLLRMSIRVETDLPIDLRGADRPPLRDGYEAGEPPRQHARIGAANAGGPRGHRPAPGQGPVSGSAHVHGHGQNHGHGQGHGHGRPATVRTTREPAQVIAPESRGPGQHGARPVTVGEGRPGQRAGAGYGATQAPKPGRKPPHRPAGNGRSTRRDS